MHDAKGAAPMVIDEASLNDRVTELHAAGGDLCVSLAQQMNESSRLAYREFGVDIAEFDLTHGIQNHTALCEPLKASHDLVTGYLRAAGELLYAVGALLVIPGELVVSPGVLSRSVAVHSARAYRLSDPFISPLERCNLCLHLVKFGWTPDKASQETLVRDIDQWKSKHQLGKPKDITQEERLVASMFEEEVDRHNQSRQPGQRKLSIKQDDNFYDRLSRLVHGNPTTLLVTLATSYQRPVINRIQVLCDVLTGLVCAYKAGNLVNDVRGGEIESYDGIYYALVDAVSRFREVRTAAEQMYHFRMNR